jgi:hypothetical protein
MVVGLETPPPPMRVMLRSRRTCNCTLVGGDPVHTAADTIFHTRDRESMSLLVNEEPAKLNRDVALQAV